MTACPLRLGEFVLRNGCPRSESKSCHDSVIRPAFVQSGFYVAKDGSENGKINLHKSIQDTFPFPDNSSDTESDGVGCGVGLRVNTSFRTRQADVDTGFHNCSTAKFQFLIDQSLLYYIAATALLLLLNYG
jgi:hypothetical protein